MRSSPIIRPAGPADEPALGHLGALLVEEHYEFDSQRFLAPRPDMPHEMEGELEPVLRLLVKNRWPFRIHATYDESIDRDLSVITNLIQNDWGMEDRMLKLNYQLMSAWCSVSKSFSVEEGRRALDEMSTIVSHFANSVGERACAGAAA